MNARNEVIFLIPNALLREKDLSNEPFTFLFRHTVLGQFDTWILKEYKEMPKQDAWYLHLAMDPELDKYDLPLFDYIAHFATPRHIHITQSEEVGRYVRENICAHQQTINQTH